MIEPPESARHNPRSFAYRLSSLFPFLLWMPPILLYLIRAKWHSFASTLWPGANRRKAADAMYEKM